MQDDNYNYENKCPKKCELRAHVPNEVSCLISDGHRVCIERLLEVCVKPCVKPVISREQIESNDRQKNLEEDRDCAGEGHTQQREVDYNLL